MKYDAHRTSSIEDERQQSIHMNITRRYYHLVFHEIAISNEVDERLCISS
jgi:hypothetical protein